MLKFALVSQVFARRAREWLAVLRCAVRAHVCVYVRVQGGDVDVCASETAQRQAVNSIDMCVSSTKRE